MRAFRPYRAWTAGLALALLGYAGASSAHHSFGFYDMKTTTEVDGTVASYEWSNPHSWLFLTVDGASGPTQYGFEMVSVGEMLRKGWKKSSLKPGDKIKVSFHPFKDGTPNGLLVTAKTEDGTLIGNPPAQ